MAPGEERTYEYLLTKASGSSLIYYHPHTTLALTLSLALPLPYSYP